MSDPQTALPLGAPSSGTTEQGVSALQQNEPYTSSATDSGALQAPEDEQVAKGKRQHAHLTLFSLTEAIEEQEESNQTKRPKLTDSDVPSSSSSNNSAPNPLQINSSTAPTGEASNSSNPNGEMPILPPLPLDLSSLRPFVASTARPITDLSSLLEKAYHERNGETGEFLSFFVRLLDFSGLLLSQLCNIQLAIARALIGAPLISRAPFTPELKSNLATVMEKWTKEGPLAFKSASSRAGSQPSTLGAVPISALPILINLLTSMQIIDPSLDEEQKRPLNLFELWTSKVSSFVPAQVTFEGPSEVEDDYAMEEPREAVMRRLAASLPRLTSVVLLVSRLAQVNHEIRGYHQDLRNKCHGVLMASLGWTNRIGLETQRLLTRLISYVEGRATSFSESHIESLESTCKEAIKEVIQLPRARDLSAPATAPTTPENAAELICRALADLRVDLCIRSNSQLNISEEEMDLIRDVLGRGALLDKLQERVSTRRIDFPWKRYTMPSVFDLFSNLQNKNCHDPRELRHNSFSVQGLQSRAGKFFSFQYCGPTGSERPEFFAFDSPKDDYDRIDIITDYFQERQRMAGRVKNASQSPLEFWSGPGNARRLFDEAMNDRNSRELRAFDVRERLFRAAKECTQFKVTLVRQVIEKLGGTRMLDFSAGWGDRLIGAMGSPGIKKYVGVDPNTDLKTGHSEMIRTLAASDRQDDFMIVYEPFQTATLPDGMTFDLVFTSPPYFDFEIYTDKPGQSILAHPTFNGWLIHFLFVSIHKAWSKLDERGHLAIHITDTRDARCCELMNLFIQSRLPGAVYEGIIGSYGQRKDIVRPIWVWRKDIAAAPVGEGSRKAEAEKLAWQHYADVWRSMDQRFGAP